MLSQQSINVEPVLNASQDQNHGQNYKNPQDHSIHWKGSALTLVPCQYLLMVTKSFF